MAQMCDTDFSGRKNRRIQHLKQKTNLSPGSIWKRPIGAGAPLDNVVANIEYSAGMYWFYIDRTKHEYNFDADGRLIQNRG
jgi:hypothetical protein